MGKSSSGSLVRKAIAWIIVAFVAIVLFKFVVAALAGLMSLVFGLLLIAAVIWAVLWALRNL
jgi:hypothetical protein